MKMIPLVLVCSLTALGLGACTTIQTNLSRAGSVICTNQDSVRAGYLSMIQAANLIEDSVIRDLTIRAAQAGLDALAACPAPAQPAGSGDS
jgi:hypothetical protein